MIYLVRLQRGGMNGAVVKSASFSSFQAAQAFVANQGRKAEADFAAIVEMDRDGKEIRTHRIEHFNA